MKQIEKIQASNCKCCECGKPAVAFWPVMDPDIPSHPYCRKCLDKTKEDLMIKLFSDVSHSIYMGMQKQKPILREKKKRNRGH